jgi:hypothetical protein
MNPLFRGPVGPFIRQKPFLKEIAARMANHEKS